MVVLLVLIGTGTPVLAAGLSQGYPVDAPIAPGSIVALASDGSGRVVPATQTLVPRVIGVVVPADSNTLSLSSSGTQVQVTTDGVATVFVSTANGDIKTGDYITVSPVTAIGMKATANGRVIGVAQEGFTRQSAGAQTIKIGSGQNVSQVAVGRIAVQVGVTTFNLSKTTPVATTAIQNFASAVAGKQVSVIKAFIAFAILLVGIVSASILLYAGVRSSIVAIGRNPLAKAPISRSLNKIIAMVIGILTVSIGSVWLVIK